MPLRTFPRRPHRRPSRRLMLPALLGVLLVAGVTRVDAYPRAAGAAPARHLRLERSAPADSSVVDSASAVRLWFSQATGLDVTRVVVRTAAGDTVRVRPLARDAAAKAPVVAAFEAPLPTGRYSVDWRTMAADGHVVRGSFRFTVAARATGP